MFRAFRTFFLQPSQQFTFTFSSTLCRTNAIMVNFIQYRRWLLSDLKFIWFLPWGFLPLTWVCFEGLEWTREEEEKRSLLRSSEEEYFSGLYSWNRWAFTVVTVMLFKFPVTLSDFYCCYMPSIQSIMKSCSSV